MLKMLTVLNLKIKNIEKKNTKYSTYKDDRCREYQMEFCGDGKRAAIESAAWLPYLLSKMKEISLDLEHEGELKPFRSMHSPYLLLYDYLRLYYDTPLIGSTFY